jgi:hypothetical protein
MPAGLAGTVTTSIKGACHAKERTANSGEAAEEGPPPSDTQTDEAKQAEIAGDLVSVEKWSGSLFVVDLSLVIRRASSQA